MSTLQPFRLLALPKELRLLIFSHLPIKITYYSWKTNTYDPDPNIKLLWPSLPGVQILSTSHQMNHEAASILYPRLRAIMIADIRIILSVTVIETTTFYALFDCLRHVNVPEFKRRFGVDVGNRPSWIKVDAGGREGRRIQVAIRRDEGFGDGEGGLDDMVQELGRRADLMSAASNRMRHTQGALDVHLRLAPRTEDERAAYELGKPLSVLGVLGQDDGDMDFLGERWMRGGYVEQGEWEQDWAEGYRRMVYELNISMLPRADRRTAGFWKSTNSVNLLISLRFDYLLCKCRPIIHHILKSSFTPPSNPPPTPSS